MAQYFVVSLFVVVAVILALLQTDYFGENSRRAACFAIGLGFLAVVSMFVFIAKEDWRSYLAAAVEEKKKKGKPGEGRVKVPKKGKGGDPMQGRSREGGKGSAGSAGMAEGGGGTRIINDDTQRGRSKKPPRKKAPVKTGSGGKPTAAAAAKSGSSEMPVEWVVKSNGSGVKDRGTSQKKYGTIRAKNHVQKSHFNNHVFKTHRRVAEKTITFSPIFHDNAPPSSGGSSGSNQGSTEGAGDKNNPQDAPPKAEATSGYDHGLTEATGDQNNPQDAPPIADATSGYDQGLTEATGDQNNPQDDTLQLLSECKYCPSMVTIPIGKYIMGSPEDEPGHDFSEAPSLPVSISKPFAIGMFEVTKFEFRQFVKQTGHKKQGQCKKKKPKGFSLAGWFGKKNTDVLPPEQYTLPAQCLSWWDANAYVEWLSEKTGLKFRLPSAAEWEYAARAMTTTAYHTGEEIDGTQAQFYRSQHAEPKPVDVSAFEPNQFGLYNMHGNIAEWVADCWHTNLYDAPSHQDAWTWRGDCKYRVTKGGSWLDGSYDLRAAARGRLNSVLGDKRIGLRVVRELY